MDMVCHRKVMDKLDVIESKLNYTNGIYTREYVIINKNFMCNVIFVLWVFLIVFGFLGIYFGFI